MKSIRRYELRVQRVSIAERVEPYGAVVQDSIVAARVAQRLLAGLTQEVGLAFHMNTRNRVVGYHEVGRGSISMCPIAPVDVFRTAIVSGAAAVIFAHNHPSGECSPSDNDDELTWKLREVGALLGIPLLDHVIVADPDQDDGTVPHYSYYTKGRLDR